MYAVVMFQCQLCRILVLMFIFQEVQSTHAAVRTRLRPIPLLHQRNALPAATNRSNASPKGMLDHAILKALTQTRCVPQASTRLALATHYIRPPYAMGQVPVQRPDQRSSQITTRRVAPLTRPRYLPSSYCNCTRYTSALSRCNSSMENCKAKLRNQSRKYRRLVTKHLIVTNRTARLQVVRNLRTRLSTCRSRNRAFKCQMADDRNLYTSQIVQLKITDSKKDQMISVLTKELELLKKGNTLPNSSGSLKRKPFYNETNEALEQENQFLRDQLDTQLRAYSSLVQGLNLQIVDLKQQIEILKSISDSQCTTPDTDVTGKTGSIYSIGPTDAHTGTETGTTGSSVGPTEAHTGTDNDYITTTVSNVVTTEENYGSTSTTVSNVVTTEENYGSTYTGGTEIPSPHMWSGGHTTTTTPSAPVDAGNCNEAISGLEANHKATVMAFELQLNGLKSDLKSCIERKAAVQVNTIRQDVQTLLDENENLVREKTNVEEQLMQCQNETSLLRTEKMSTRQNCSSLSDLSTENMILNATVTLLKNQEVSCNKTRSKLELDLKNLREQMDKEFKKLGRCERDLVDCSHQHKSVVNDRNALQGLLYQERTDAGSLLNDTTARLEECLAKLNNCSNSTTEQEKIDKVNSDLQQCLQENNRNTQEKFEYQNQSVACLEDKIYLNASLVILNSTVTYLRAKIDVMDISYEKNLLELNDQLHMFENSYLVMQVMMKNLTRMNFVLQNITTKQTADHYKEKKALQSQIQALTELNNLLKTNETLLTQMIDSLSQQLETQVLSCDNEISKLLLEADQDLINCRADAGILESTISALTSEYNITLVHDLSSAYLQEKQNYALLRNCQKDFQNLHLITDNLQVSNNKLQTINKKLQEINEENALQIQRQVDECNAEKQKLANYITDLKNIINSKI